MHILVKYIHWALENLERLINYNSCCYSRMDRLRSIYLSRHKNNLSGFFLQKVIFLLLRQKSSDSFYCSEGHWFIYMAFSRMGYLIKIGIRGFLWHDLFPGWRNCAHRGRLPTSADTIIPGITNPRSAEYHHIKTFRLSFLPYCLLSIFTVFHFCLLHLINADLAPVISRALSICHACVMGPIFRYVSAIFHCA